ncbi:glycosyltransferase family 4 protein [Spirosoma endophyticum]|uniref:Glycosyltransferase involved in cell wall bisynthesis n=1 Tax=Spirosoma endophyticum TaxID=662367 RepID=A0A1I2FTE3_9BACT|nr:glycosyltransferase family 4 protein [Spirosoma endophyticum]SFF07786.1 Glycosyltransferase involved in cell wall bisynthesis [Spirosoma endophyticum]
MKILWVNPSFLDYRIPVYKKIFELNNKNFFLIYSKNRVPQRVISKIESAIGDHAIGLSDELVLNFKSKSDFANTEFKIPYQPGLYNAILKVDADIIIGEGFFQWTPMAILIAKLKKRKLLIAYERTAHTERNCPKWRALYRKFISKFVDGYSINGSLTKDYLIQLGVKADQLFVGGMSADSENLVASFNSVSLNEIQALKSKLLLRNGLTFLYIGQINERKGVIPLLEAWKSHNKLYPNDNLILIGTGPLYDKCKEDFSHIDSIYLIGSIDYDLIHHYYAIANVFIIPTLEDNWSLVVPEAMSCGLPIACSIYNGCYPELVQEGLNGKLFDPLKETSVIDALAYFHNKDLEQMGKESKNIEKKYNASSVALNIYNMCNEII